MNVDLSGGEKKRNETLQLPARARIAILDELDSGLDVDALRACARRIEQATHETGLGVLAITHYNRLLDELHPDVCTCSRAGASRAPAGPSWPGRSSRPATRGEGPGAVNGRPRPRPVRRPLRTAPRGYRGAMPDAVLSDAEVAEAWSGRPGASRGALHRSCLRGLRGRVRVHDPGAAEAERLDHYPDWSNSGTRW